MQISRLSKSLPATLVGAVLLGGAALVSVGVSNSVSADISSGDRPVFVPINPCRLLDTRAAASVGPRTTPLGAEEITLLAHGSNGECVGASAIPTDAVGLSLNVTAVAASQQTFLTFWGDGDNPGTSNLNPSPNSPPTPNAVNTPLSATGTFNVANAVGTVEVLIDVNGFFANHNHDDLYVDTGSFDELETTVGDLETAGEQLATTVEGLETTVEVLGDTTLLTSGTVSGTTVSGLNAPAGAIAVATNPAVGSYTVTISGVPAAASPVVQITPFAVSANDARSCALASPIQSGTTLTFEVACFEEDMGVIVAADAEFQFLAIG